MLQLTNIHLSFGKKLVLKDLTCTINEGDFVIIVGSNGAGKSSLFDIIAGKLTPTQGSIRLDGKEVTAASEQHRAPLIGRLFQNPSLNCVTSMTVAQNLSMATFKNRPVTFDPGLHAELMTQWNALLTHHEITHPHLLETKMGALSGGQRQLISFIMTTIAKPRLLLLDEPTAALDPQAATKLLKLAKKYNDEQKLTTLLITHDPYLALALGNKVWVLERDAGTITKTYEGNEKQSISPQDLVGHIDYSTL